MHTASPVVPAALRETIDWLLSVEDFGTVRSLLGTLSRFLPESDPLACDFVASVLLRAKCYKEAASVAERTVALLPESIEARFNAAKCLAASGRPDAAERLIREVIAGRPDWIEARIDLAVYVARQGRLDEAKEALEALLAIVPADDRNHDVLRFNLGWHRLRYGDFKTGMKMLGAGRRLRIWGAMAQTHPRPMLNVGTDLHAKTVLLCGEGGAGDEMINVRFAQVIAARGGRVLWQGRAGLATLFARAPGVSAVVTDAGPPACDYWAPCMDLPRLLDLDLQEVPSAAYLSPDPSLAAHWRKRLPPGRRLKVGIRWRGNHLYEQDLARAVPFSLLEELTKLRGVTVYSLQRDEGSEERPPDSRVVDLGPELRTWEDTAAAIAQLDLVVSSCTSVPHLAAAMGKPVWLFCPINPYYIWATPGDLSPWYPRVRLFRQTRLGDWTGPFSDLRARLKIAVRDRDML
jgi:hypothetical protein